MRLAARNVLTLLDRADRHERRSAIIARELARYRIDIAALSETRLSGSLQFEEVGAGYTFFWQGYPEGEMRQPSWTSHKSNNTPLAYTTRQFTSSSLKAT